MSSPIVTVGAGVTVNDVSKMFDLDTSTYTTFNTTNSSLYVNIYFKKPTKIKELVMLLGNKYFPQADFLYADDTDSSSYGYTGFLTFSSYNGVGGASYTGQVANPLPDKEVTGIKFTMYPDTSGNVYVYEIYIYKQIMRGKLQTPKYVNWNDLPLVTTEIYDPTQTSTSDTVGTGDGSTTSFSATLSNVPVVPKSTVTHYTIGGTAYTASDDGEGNISGTDVSGTINYDTGAISLTFTTAPDSGTSITCDYNYYTNGNGIEVNSMTDGYVHITISGIVSSTVYITPALDGIDEKNEQLIYTADTDEIIPVKYVGGTLTFGAYRTGSDYITLTISEVRRE